MGGSAPIWAVRSADTRARPTRASCAQPTRPGSLSAPPGRSSHTIPEPGLPKTTPSLALQRGSSWACLGGPQRSVCGLVSHSRPGDVCSVSGSQSGPSMLPSRNPPTNFLPATLKCLPDSLPLLPPFPCPEQHHSCLVHRAHSYPFPARHRSSSAQSPVTVPTEGPHLSMS